MHIGTRTEVCAGGRFPVGSLRVDELSPPSRVGECFFHSEEAARPLRFHRSHVQALQQKNDISITVESAVGAGNPANECRRYAPAIAHSPSNDLTMDLAETNR